MPIAPGFDWGVYCSSWKEIPGSLFPLCLRIGPWKQLAKRQTCSRSSRTSKSAASIGTELMMQVAVKCRQYLKTATFNLQTAADMEAATTVRENS